MSEISNRQIILKFDELKEQQKSIFNLTKTNVRHVKVSKPKNLVD